MSELNMPNDKLPAEWEAIIQKCLDSSRVAFPLREIVESCYVLSCKPARKLTDAEIDAVDGPYGYFKYVYEQDDVRHAFARAIIAAYQRKQREPETVTFRAARRIDDGLVDVFTNLPAGNLWEWLDVDGEPQTLEVKLPC